ncbi:MAG: hypothetical protein AT709_00810 [Caldivirga sp. MG_3]|nr:MAG: hypothetical protein AT709_00810 [Caldivirga sp. MG_3]
MLINWVKNYQANSYFNHYTEVGLNCLSNVDKYTNSFRDNPWIVIIREHPTNAERLRHYGVKVRQLNAN